ncbi:cytochrome-c oxidase [Paenibacillus aceris]|uniref:Cbb3-type cytochrome oxidase subunit 1 n=1 Tax=Paenibacillus aceris TaxID=869555 RepID=A0ABS4IA40_9BACL|nr:cytochrome-c oxidase [Paenibacillus aceris]MBP1966939.1 cbb3-type cytochrome oxidase subunit 1 [Paenibacillus aceris]NHW39303.1 cytochrome-c oxidase [Paenibacillus aceris]
MAKTFLKIAAIYISLGVLLGMLMGIIQDFRLASVHAHLNLLGWVSMAIFGLIYHFYPHAAETRLAKLHFWLHNIGLPLMQGGLAIELISGNSAMLPLVIVSSLLVVIGVILFTINLFRQLGSTSVKQANKKDMPV